MLYTDPSLMCLSCWPRQLNNKSLEHNGRIFLFQTFMPERGEKKIHIYIHIYTESYKYVCVCVRECLVFFYPFHFDKGKVCEIRIWLSQRIMIPVQIMISDVRTFQREVCERWSFVRGKAVLQDAEVSLHSGCATSEPGPCLLLCPSHGLTLRNFYYYKLYFCKKQEIFSFFKKWKLEDFQR